MLVGFLLATQFCLMSDRTMFWDAEKIANQTAIWKEGNIKSTFDSKDIEGKKILLLVHGYNNDFAEALSAYHVINTHISAFSDFQNSTFYDLVIGYLWPGDDTRLEYYDAKSRVPKLSKKMRENLELISKSALKLDVLAHSMGNFLMFEALNYEPSQSKKVVQNFFSIAPAVDNESLEVEQKYYFSTQNCEKIFVFLSKKDDVLKWFYTLAEWDKALGYEGAENIQNLPPNVQLINYTNFVDNHSQYFTFPPFYEFIKQQFVLENPKVSSEN